MSRAPTPSFGGTEMRFFKLALVALAIVVLTSVAGQILWGDSIVWGAMSDGDQILWGTLGSGGDQIIWGD